MFLTQKNILLKSLFIIGLGILIYANALHGTFQFDDAGYIARNDDIRDLSNIAAIWNNFSHPSRFIGLLSFAVNFHFHQNEVFGYHIVNLGIHILNAFLVWWFIQLLFKTPVLNKQYALGYATSVSFIAALIFLTHPIQTQAVSYISQRLASMATLFYLLSVCFYLKGRFTIKGRAFFVVLAVVALILGMFTKQITFTVPFMILLIEAMFFETQWKAIKRWHVMGCVVLICLIPAMFRFNIFNVLGHTQPSGSHYGDTITAWSYFLTQFRVIIVYIKLLFVPIGQNLDYDFPLSHSFIEWHTFCSFVILALIVYVAMRLYKQERLISFAILWFFLTLSVEASVIPIRHVIFEHRVYLPSIGFCLLISALLGRWCVRPKKLLIIVSIIIVTLSYLTIERNKVWQNIFTLWSDVAKKSPNKARAYNNLALGFLEQQENNKAFFYVNKALALNPEFFEALNNRAVVYKRTNQLELALKDLDYALQIRPDYMDALYNRGNAYRRMGRNDEALKDFNRVIEISPKFIEAYNERGILYKQMGEIEKALNDYTMAININPYYGDARYNRANIYTTQKKYKAALEDYNVAITTKKDFIEAFDQRGILLRLIKHYDLAIADHTQAIKINPLYVSAYYNRAKAYVAVGQDTLAFNDLNKAIAIDSRMARAYNDRGILYKKHNNIDLALGDFNRALELNPEYVDAYNNRGNVYTDSRQFDKAIMDYSHALRIDPRFPATYYNRGLAYEMNKQYEPARVSFSKVIELDPGFAPAYYHRGFVLSALEKPKEALIDFEKARSLGIDIKEELLQNLRSQASK